MASAVKVLTLYKQLLRAAGGFSNYNFREYAIRHVRDDFRASQLASASKVPALYDAGCKRLQDLNRQVMISQLYPQGKHAMES
eukprot:CAMPEP_0183356092 /NCGR_PEP_ID=MMETSP0164_2-20130417/43056_1 /TAXON_ID=221442 /ORGANISM="Coccolithus pelagicus ssp braarudi, Strain PLY182g" /LENGTH=82 /DNA_ID=CAMNT_0025529399 /DNA_START=74 /DNA_END=322 /DNA_ORIENTATION=+